MRSASRLVTSSIIEMMSAIWPVVCARRVSSGTVTSKPHSNSFTSAAATGVWLSTASSMYSCEYGVPAWRR